jgi:hypothetical protein
VRNARTDVGGELEAPRLAAVLDEPIEAGLVNGNLPFLEPLDLVRVDVDA